MSHYKLTFLFASLFFCSLCATVPDVLAPPIKENDQKGLKASENISQTIHEITLDGHKFTYTATASTITLKNEKEEPTAHIFYVSYHKNDEKEDPARPITFCFNGGPGAASVWIHMGLLGPKRIQCEHENQEVPPYALIENEYSLLDATDLVFIDPVSTGFSRAIPPSEEKKFHGVNEDVKSIAEFIQMYLSQNDYWDHPKFIIGESYGTLRAAALASYLHDESHIYVNGLVLVSTVLNYQLFDFSKNNDLPYLLYLPSYTAAAWTHHKLAPDLQKDLTTTLNEAKNFVQQSYVQALFKGSLLTKEENDQVVKNLSRFTGLSPEYIENCNLRIDLFRFLKELLRSEHKTIGRFDSRITGVDVDSAGEHSEYDPAIESVCGAFTAAINHYLIHDLKYKESREYMTLTNVFPWNFDSDNCYCNVSDSLRSTMSKNPQLRVFVACGYYDLATPFYEVEYTFNHLNLSPSLRPHVTMKFYEGGHMMFLNESVLKQMKPDLKRFYQQTLLEQKQADKKS